MRLPPGSVDFIFTRNQWRLLLMKPVFCFRIVYTISMSALNRDFIVQGLVNAQHKAFLYDGVCEVRDNAKVICM
jgi:hypothetical protein